MGHVAIRRALYVSLLVCLSVFGQRDLGTITGTVTDPTGAAVPRAKITITEDATGLSYDAETNGSGEYVRSPFSLDFLPVSFLPNPAHAMQSAAVSPLMAFVPMVRTTSCSMVWTTMLT